MRRGWFHRGLRLLSRRAYAARRMRLGPVLLDAERLSFARAQRTDATQHFAVLCHLHSAPMGEF